MSDSTRTAQTEAILLRYRRLQELKLRTDAEIVALEQGLRVAGVLSRRGRPERLPTHTVEQCREAHARYQRGERSDWIEAGERQYKRERRRADRLRGSS